MSDLVGYLIVGGVAAAVTAIATPVVAKFARQYGWMATPDARRSHPEPTPDVGAISKCLHKQETSRRVAQLCHELLQFSPCRCDYAMSLQYIRRSTASRLRACLEL